MPLMSVANTILTPLGNFALYLARNYSALKWIIKLIELSARTVACSEMRAIIIAHAKNKNIWKFLMFNI